MALDDYASSDLDVLGDLISKLHGENPHFGHPTCAKR